VVSGAKLQLERGKLSLRVKYSLLTAMVPDDEYPLDEHSWNSLPGEANVQLIYGDGACK